jgi:hypothetical protein
MPAMENEEAKMIAGDFVAKENQLLTQFKLGVGEMTEFLRHYYFDFRLLNTDGEEYNGPPMGGAPGLIISKSDKQTKTVSFGELAKLRMYEKDIDDIYEVLVDVKEDKSLHRLKSKFNLTSEQILKIIKELSHHTSNRKTALKLISETVGDLDHSQ